MNVVANPFFHIFSPINWHASLHMCSLIAQNTSIMISFGLYFRFTMLNNLFFFFFLNPFASSEWEVWKPSFIISFYGTQMFLCSSQTSITFSVFLSHNYLAHLPHPLNSIYFFIRFFSLLPHPTCVFLNISFQWGI